MLEFPWTGKEIALDSPAIEDLMLELEETGNPYLALVIFNASMRLGFFPPRSVMEFLQHGISKYLDDYGRISLDKSLGLDKGVSGCTPPAAEAIKARRDEMLMLDMLHLTAIAKIRPSAASRMVSEKLRSMYWAPHNVIKPDSIARMFRAWGDRGKHDTPDFHEDYGEQPWLFAEYLRSYPMETIERHAPELIAKYRLSGEK